jgi:site-specific recombinase XerD
MEKFIKYMESKNHAKSTQKIYLLAVRLFFKWAKKEDTQITKSDMLKYLEYLKKRKGLQNVSRSVQLVALNHYFTYLYQSEQITQNPCLLLKIRGTKKKKLHKIYTPEELDLLYDSYYQLFVRSYDDNHIPKNQRKQASLNRQRNALILSILIYQGISTNEIETLELNDIDLTKAQIKIKGGKHLNDRILSLKATQIGLFINYLQNIRPQLTEYQINESEKLFLPLPKSGNKTTDSNTLKYAVKPLAKQMKIIDKQFINFCQIRASVITFWIKTHGLRKAQHFAGHRHIISTKNYMSNDIDNLTEDINKLHPF